MTDDTDTSWSKSEILANLAKAAKDRPRVHVFLEDGPASDMQTLPMEIIRESDPNLSTQMGGVKKLARSFWVEGNIETLGRIANNPHVKAILPAEVEDILPRPINRKRKSEQP